MKFQAIIVMFSLVAASCLEDDLDVSNFISNTLTLKECMEMVSKRQLSKPDSNDGIRLKYAYGRWRGGISIEEACKEALTDLPLKHVSVTFKGTVYKYPENSLEKPIKISQWDKVGPVSKGINSDLNRTVLQEGGLWYCSTELARRSGADPTWGKCIKEEVHHSLDYLAYEIKTQTPPGPGGFQWQHHHVCECDTRVRHSWQLYIDLRTTAPGQSRLMQSDGGWLIRDQNTQRMVWSNLINLNAFQCKEQGTWVGQFEHDKHEW